MQDFDPQVQAAINGIQPEEPVAGATEAARRLGFSGISYDLIYGLPHQTLATIEDTVRRTIAIAPDCISIFSYAHVRNPCMSYHSISLPAAFSGGEMTQLPLLPAGCVGA